MTPVRAFGTRSNVEKSLASPVKAAATNAHYTGIKRSAEIVQSKTEKQAELASKRPKLVASLARRRKRRRRGVKTRLSWAKRQGQAPRSYDQKSNQSESYSLINTLLTAQRKEENAVTEDGL